VALATAGDYYYTTVGLLLTLLGTLLAALKTILTHRIQKGRSPALHPIDLLLRMSPLACVQSLLYSFFFDEPRGLIEFMSTLTTAARVSLALKLAFNGAIAFGLNYVSFAANKKTSPLTMTVAANIKQCLSIVLGIWVFHLHVEWMNACGILVALGGGAWYAYIEIGDKARRQQLLETGSGISKLSEKESV